jgi:Na+/H+-translocating membrane pyrophosphatase
MVFGKKAYGAKDYIIVLIVGIVIGFILNCLLTKYTEMVGTVCSYVQGFV